MLQGAPNCVRTDDSTPGFVRVCRRSSIACASDRLRRPIGNTHKHRIPSPAPPALQNIHYRHLKCRGSNTEIRLLHPQATGLAAPTADASAERQLDGCRELVFQLSLGSGAGVSRCRKRASKSRASSSSDNEDVTTSGPLGSRRTLKSWASVIDCYCPRTTPRSFCCLPSGCS